MHANVIVDYNPLVKSGYLRNIGRLGSYLGQQELVTLLGLLSEFFLSAAVVQILFLPSVLRVARLLWRTVR